MKKGSGRASAARLAGTCVLLIATTFSPEALAQGGRAAQGRGSTSTRVERQDTGRKQAKAVERTAARKTQRARKVERTRDQNKAVQSGRRGKATAMVRGSRSGRGGQVGSAGSGTGQTRARRVERSDNGRQAVRDQRGGVAARKQTRVERGRVDGDGRRAYADRSRDDRIRDGRRSRYVRPRYERERSIRDLYTHRDRYLYHKRRHRPEYAWCNTYHHHGHHHYVDAHVHIGSHLYLGIAWPWEVRYRSHWRPRFRYRQVVYVDAGWGGRRFRNRVELQTYYRHRILFANDRYSEVEIEIDAIDLYQNGRFLSTVDRIPGNLRKVRAVIHADGLIEFDRNLFLMGDTQSGFELIATRYYADNLFDAYDRGHGFRVGRVDLRRGKVKDVRRSRFFDHGRFAGYAPISLLPDDDRLWDYGRPVSDRFNHRGPEEGWYRDFRGVNSRPYDGDYELSREFLDTYTTSNGGDVRLERATTLDRLN